MPRPANVSRQTRLLLEAFAAQPRAWRYGYELTKATGVGSGTLYPALARLKEQGLLESDWMPSAEPGRPPRHAYRLTASGIAFARAQPAKAAPQSREVLA